MASRQLQYYEFHSQPCQLLCPRVSTFMQYVSPPMQLRLGPLPWHYFFPSHLAAFCACCLQEVTQQLMSEFNCHPVFLGAELKNNYYKSEGHAARQGGIDAGGVSGVRPPGGGPWSSSKLPGRTAAVCTRTNGLFVPPAVHALRVCRTAPPWTPFFLRPPPHRAAGFCKQQLWPILHYLIPLNPNSLGRFDRNLWSAYVRANMAFANKLVEVRACAPKHLPSLAAACRACRTARTNQGRAPCLCCPRAIHTHALRARHRLPGGAYIR